MVKGFRDEYHPNRQVGRGRWPTTPPQSEQPNRGVMTNPNTQDYAPVTGSPGRFYTPDRMMTVGIGRRTPTSPPQSEQPGRGTQVPELLGPLRHFPGSGEGLESVQPNPDTEATEDWLEENQPPNFNESGYLAPVAQYINDTQFTPT